MEESDAEWGQWLLEKTRAENEERTRLTKLEKEKEEQKLVVEATAARSSQRAHATPTPGRDQSRHDVKKPAGEQGFAVIALAADRGR